MVEKARSGSLEGIAEDWLVTKIGRLKGISRLRRMHFRP